YSPLGAFSKISLTGKPAPPSVFLAGQCPHLQPAFSTPRATFVAGRSRVIKNDNSFRIKAAPLKSAICSAPVVHNVVACPENHSQFTTKGTLPALSFCRACPKNVFLPLGPQKPLKTQRRPPRDTFPTRAPAAQIQTAPSGPAPAWRCSPAIQFCMPLP